METATIAEKDLGSDTNSFFGRPEDGTSQSIEQTPGEIRKFNPETKKALRDQGYIFYTLTGQSVASLRESGRHFFTKWHIGQPFEELPSRKSEVAIKPEEFVLQVSDNRPLWKQIKRVESETTRFNRTVKGAKKVIGGVADLAELAFLHLDATKKNPDYLFGKNHGYHEGITTTRVNDSQVASIGIFGEWMGKHGLHIYQHNAGRGAPSVSATCMVVPA